MLSEHVERVLHVGGQVGFEFDDFAGGGVGEFEAVCVEGDSADDGLFDGGFGVLQLPGIDELSAVHVVGDDGVFDVGHVYADLVGPAGLWEEHNERVAAEAFEDFVECY